MDGIYYNQEITEEDLNAMATDLGHTSFNGFDGVTKFGADKLNEITKALVTSGVLTSGDMCRCEKTDTGITVNTGTIVFKNGAKKTISEAIQIEADDGMAVYALNNIVAGTCTIETSADFPTDTETDYIPLCKINSDGTLSDKRSVSRAKVDFPTVIATEVYDYDVTGSKHTYLTLLDVSDLTWTRHNYFLIDDVTQGFTFIKKIQSTSFDSEVYLGDSCYAKFIKTGEGIKIKVLNGDGINSFHGQVFFI